MNGRTYSLAEVLAIVLQIPSVRDGYNERGKRMAQEIESTQFAEEVARAGAIAALNGQAAVLNECFRFNRRELSGIENPMVAAELQRAIKRDLKAVQRLSSQLQDME